MDLLDRIIWIELDGEYQLDCIDYIVQIVLDGLLLDYFGWIALVLVLRSIGDTGFYVLDGFLMSGWDKWNGWYIGETRVGFRVRHYQAPGLESIIGS